VGDKEYSKYVVVIPPESVDKLGWKEGQELEEHVQGKKLVLSSKHGTKEVNTNAA
jgi:bifunctional DNA-binding transcriptional regulator/antitoxin component of YhaV-PrlF toxin-antitoxin module